MSSPNNSTVIRRPTDLPVRFEDWKRKLKSQPTINDMVEAILPSLWEKSERLQALLNATTNEESVEGSMIADNLCAAGLIRDAAAHDDPNHPLAKKNMVAISKSLNVVTRRYDYGRHQRRQMVSGEIVPDNSSE